MGAERAAGRWSGWRVGLVAALVLGRTLSGFLYGVSATDPVTFAAVAALLLADRAPRRLRPGTPRGPHGPGQGPARGLTRARGGGRRKPPVIPCRTSTSGSPRGDIHRARQPHRLLRGHRPPGRGRHGRGLPRPRHAAGPDRGPQGPAPRRRPRAAAPARPRGARRLARSTIRTSSTSTTSARPPAEEGAHYVVMELVEGETLRRRLRRARCPWPSCSTSARSSPTAWPRRTAPASSTAT